MPHGATGTVAVIDVFRAFTTAAVALAEWGVRDCNGSHGRGGSPSAKGVSAKSAWARFEVERRTILISATRLLRAPDDFDFGNSPFEISGVDFGDTTIVQPTSAGAEGIVAAATKADRLYAASLVTEATVLAVLSGSPNQGLPCRNGRQYSLKVENIGQVADSSIFQPEPEKYR